MPEELKQPIVNIEEEMQQSYMDYAMSVIAGRALPDVRDGLKPVQRRILFAMLGEGLLSNRRYSKCAGVVGEVLKRLHPHGDSSVYDALVRLAQSWALRYPLIDGQGNFGSIDGDPAAAYRYTECRMSNLAEQLLADIDKDTVEFETNFDDSSTEPTVLPTLVPNLLVNGADGIAVGMATHIPPHNLGEVVDGCIALLKNPETTLEELMRCIPGPDFPTGGVIHGRGPILSAYAKGRGILKVRGKAELETIKSGSKEVEAIIIKEIPFQLSKASLVEKIGNLIHDKAIEGISKLRDESDRKGMRIVMELKRDATSEIVLNQLYKLTPFQSSFGIINLAIVEGRPQVCTLPELLTCFLDHRRDVVTRRAVFELRKAEERMHILEGFRIALLNLDDVIALIKKADTPKEAKQGLRDQYELSDLQAQAILELRLQKLTGMERLAVEKEHEELAAEISQLKELLADPAKIDAVIEGELTQIREKFADERRTEIIDDGAEIEMEDLIEDEWMVVTVSHAGYVKRTPADTYRAQGRGGKGVFGSAQADGDFIQHLFVASSLAELLIFTSEGRVYSKKVYSLPQQSRTARGRALVNLLELREDENLAAVRPVNEFAENRYVVLATRQGIVKRTDQMNFIRASRKGGLTACSLGDDDNLIGVAVTHGDDDVLLATRSGMAIRFSEDNLRPMGRTARGVKGVSLADDDQVVGMVVIAGDNGGSEEEDERPGADAMLLTVCENGYGKRTRFSDYRAQNRGGKGLIDIQTDDRNGPVVGICAVRDEHDVMIITSNGKVIRIHARDISVVGRNTKGVRLVNLDEGEKVSAISPVREDDEEEGAAGEGVEDSAEPAEGE